MITCIRTYLGDDGLAFYECQSRSRSGLWHSPVINIFEGVVDCNCEDFDFRKGAHGREVFANVPNLHCIHIQSALADCIRRGEIRVIKMTFAPQFKPGVLTR